MQGRKPKPSALHELHGTTNTTRHKNRRLEPKAEGDLLADPPAHLSESQAASWRYAVENAPRGVLKRIDRSVLAIWVEAEDRHRRAMVAQTALDRDSLHPLLSVTKEGGLMVSPYVTIMSRTAVVLMKAAAELGFTPSSRPRLVAPGGKGGGFADEDDKDASPFAAVRALQVVKGGRA